MHYFSNKFLKIGLASALL